MAGVGDSHVEVPVGRALTVKVYDYASAVLVVEANVILAVVKVVTEKRLAIVRVGE